MPNAVLHAILDALCQYWLSQSLLPSPNPAADVVALAQAKGITLPADFVALYQRANGMVLTFPKDHDDNGSNFLSVGKLPFGYGVLLVHIPTYCMRMNSEQRIKETFGMFLCQTDAIHYTLKNFSYSIKYSFDQP